LKLAASGVRAWLQTRGSAPNGRINLEASLELAATPFFKIVTAFLMS
jgi:hypothetical protein